MISMKMRYLTIGVLLLMLSFAAFKLPSHAQDTDDPAATEDPCTAIIEAGMQLHDNTGPVATEDPTFESCLEALVSMRTDATPDTNLVIRDARDEALVSTGTDATNLATPDTSLTNQDASVMDATDTIGPATEAADNIYIPITIIHSNSFADAGRVWVIWHAPSTGALTASLGAYNTRISYYNTGLDITIPNNVVNIGIRIETTQNRSSGNWQFNPTCVFAFAKPPQGFSINVDDNNVCTGQLDNS